jgi:hypothetical protein
MGVDDHAEGICDRRLRTLFDLTPLGQQPE